MKNCTKIILLHYLFVLTIIAQPTWQWQNPQPQGNFLTDICFIDSLNGWAAGYNGLLMKTTDGGENWVSKWNSNDDWFNTIFFHDRLNGWLGASDTLYNTTDGGETWTPNFYPGATDIHFINMNEGWFCSFFNVYKTTNGGNSWSSYYTGSIHEIHSIYFINNNIGWAVGDNGKIVKTIDGGVTWVPQLSFTNMILSSVYFLNENVRWIVGESGSILKTTNGGVTFVEEEKIFTTPKQYHLSNNFPNPFNPITKIRFTVPQTSNVVIKVFDILGNEIETLVSEEKQTGTYKLTWYAEGLPSGVYFYQLRTSDPSTGSGQNFVETKKMLLIK